MSLNFTKGSLESGQWSVVSGQLLVVSCFLVQARLGDSQLL